MDLNLLRKRRNLEFAERIAKLAAKSPDVETKRTLYAAVNFLRSRYGFSDDEKKNLIIEAIENGAITQTDIVEETFIPQQIVSELLEQLKLSGRVKSVKISLSYTGRPSTIWKIIS